MPGSRQLAGPEPKTADRIQLHGKELQEPFAIQTFDDSQGVPVGPNQQMLAVIQYKTLLIDLQIQATGTTSSLRGCVKHRDPNTTFCEIQGSSEPSPSCTDNRY